MLRAIDTVQRTDTGRQRRGNEDSSFVRAPLFVVADGMGGAQAGEVASQIAVRAFQRGLPADGSPEDRLSAVVRQANREIHDTARSDRALDGMGTTVTAAYLGENDVAVAHVGDSRAYRFRDGELERLTDDHSLVEELVREGKLTAEEAAEHPQRSIITRALGPEPDVAVDTFVYPARNGDVFLLCSDGLTSMISEQQVAEILRQPGSLDDAGRRLIDAANAAGGRDNITVVLFRAQKVHPGWFDVAQPTTVSEAVDGRILGGPAGAGESPATPPPPASGPATPDALAPERSATARAPLARTQGPPPKSERRFGVRGKLVAATVAIGFVLFFFGGGGYLASRQLYFLGTNRQGTIVVYRGFPYVLPFGIPMYETFYVSGVPAQTIPADRRATLLNHDLRDQNAATKLINQVEAGQISG